ncbi:hypothetical protein AVEN_121338-1, partial [Araneus ventricosus]
MCMLLNSISDALIKEDNLQIFERISVGALQSLYRYPLINSGNNPDSKEGCGKVAISLSIGCPRKHFRENRLGNHCRKVYIGKLFMNYLTDK